VQVSSCMTLSRMPSARQPTSQPVNQLAGNDAGACRQSDQQQSVGWELAAILETIFGPVSTHGRSTSKCVPAIAKPCCAVLCGCVMCFVAACKLQAEFEQITTLSEQLHNEPRPYDVATCMFAIHYFFDKEDSLNHLLETVAANLKPGGCQMWCTLQGTHKQCWTMPGPAELWTCLEQVRACLLCGHGMCCCNECPAATLCCCTCCVVCPGGYFIGCVPDGKRVKAHLQASKGLYEAPHLRLKALSDVRTPSCRPE
jgi:hypothetical protein